MITCKPARGADEVDVTFAVPDNTQDDQVAVVGDFNDWDPKATPLRKQGSQRVATLTVVSGRRYAFRYLGDDGRWFNDDDADAYESNDFGGENAVLDLSRVR